MIDRGNDDTARVPHDPRRATQVRAALRAAAQGPQPRVDFVAELETHLRRQPPAPPGTIARRGGGFRAAILVVVAALALGALALGGARFRMGTGTPALAAGGTPLAALTPVRPVPTALSDGQLLPAGGAVAVASGFAVWVPTWLADPTVVYLLLTLGALAVLLELLHPGAFVPGVVGGVALLLGGIGLLALPLNGAGLLLLLLALALVATDIRASTHGALTFAALVAFVPGSLFLFRPQPAGQPSDTVALPVIVALAALLGAFGLGVGAVAARTRALAPYRYALPEGGMVATTVGPLAPLGVVQVAGQLWSARTATPPIAADSPVRVLSREGLTLLVQPLDSGVAGESEFPDVEH